MLVYKMFTKNRREDGNSQTSRQTDAESNITSLAQVTLY